MEKLLKKFNQNRSFLIYRYLKRKHRFYLSCSIHQRINLKSRLESFYLNSLIHQFKQPY